MSVGMCYIREIYLKSLKRTILQKSTFRMFRMFQTLSNVFISLQLTNNNVEFIEISLKKIRANKVDYSTIKITLKKVSKNTVDISTKEITSKKVRERKVDFSTIQITSKKYVQTKWIFRSSKLHRKT